MDATPKTTSGGAGDDPIAVEVSLVDQLSETEWKRIEAILRAGGAVDVEFALAEIPIAPVVVLARRNGQIVGIGAVKRPREGYAKDKQEKAGQAFDPKMCELGYVAVDEALQGRGVSSRIIDWLLKAFPNELFSTTDSDKMKGSLERRGFKQAGQSWRGNRGELSLWIRTIPD